MDESDSYSESESVAEIEELLVLNLALPHNIAASEKACNVLDRLRCPTSSKLARKRKLQRRNFPTGLKLVFLVQPSSAPRFF